MQQSLVVGVRLHDGRYHGAGQWPPAPARLFQALLAGAACGAALPAKAEAALEWLEQQQPPTIAAPRARKGQRVTNFVPNNDLDSVGCDPDRVPEIRAAKIIQPYLFEEGQEFLYVWPLVSSACEALAKSVCDLASTLYQFGRGVDMAYAWGELVDNGILEERLTQYPGAVHRPSPGNQSVNLQSPVPGSLSSLLRRFLAATQRFVWMGSGADRQLALQQAPPPRFQTVEYDGKVWGKAYDFQSERRSGYPLSQASQLIERLRANACERLCTALPDKQELLRRVFCGIDSRGDSDKAERIRVLPLPSIGHRHADHVIRKVYVEVPSSCPVGPADVDWAFSGLPLLDGVDPGTGEVAETFLAPASDENMSLHYGVEGAFTKWRTITPVAVAMDAARRRIEPCRQRQEAKPGSERLVEERAAIFAVVQALRHVNISAPVTSIKVQREPFQSKGERAERFAKNTRFHKEQLWHVEILFEEPVAGPIAVGNGRFLGLGVMAPDKVPASLLAYKIVSGLQPCATESVVTRALHRAVIARAQHVTGQQGLSDYFHGHNETGAQSSHDHRHLAYIADLANSTLYILSPKLINRNYRLDSDFTRLVTAMAGFRELRAGQAGRLSLVPENVDATSPLFGTALEWSSATDYIPTRHPKRKDGLHQFLINDITTELRRRDFPVPATVEVLETHTGPQGSVRARFRLLFRVPVSGPILLGRTCHRGGGRFFYGAKS